ncbi:MAG: hypothetical protein AAB215_03945 [Planctomycetota bacterium]
MARAIGRAKSGFWWLVGFLCAFFFQSPGAFAQAQAEYGVRVEPDPRGLKKSPSPHRRPPPRVPMPPPVDDRIREPGWRPPTTPETRFSAERLLNRLTEPVKAVEPTEAELAGAKRSLETLLKSAADSEAHAKAGRTEEARKSNEERLAAFKSLADLGPAALGLLRERAADFEKGAKASEFVRSQPRLAIQRIEGDARKSFEAEFLRLGQASLEAVRDREKETRTAREGTEARVKRLEGEVAGAAGEERERLQRDLDRAKESLREAQAREEFLRSLEKKISEAVPGESPPRRPPRRRELLPPDDVPRASPLYGPPMRGEAGG